MAKYKLLGQHYSEEDKLLEPGTEVGDGTEHKWTRRPTVEMEGLDDDGKGRVQYERDRTGEYIQPIDDLPLTMGEADKKYDEEVAAAQSARRQTVTAADRARR